MFSIEQVQAISENGVISEVNFTTGLNIIVGPSNRGKTMVLKCIDYLLGAKSISLRKDKYHISLLKMKVNTNDGYAILSREVDSDVATIESHTRMVPSGEFATGRTKDAFNYGQVLMGLFGVRIGNHPVPVFKSKDAKVAPLSIRQVINTFIIKENPIINPKNILVPDGSSLTAVESAILYFLSGENHVTGNEKDSYWVAAKKSLKKYIDSKVKELEANNDFLTMGICTGSEETAAANAENMVENLDSEYEEIQERYSQSVAEFGESSKKVSQLSEALVQQEEMIDKCTSLKEQYEADVRRIRFSLDGHILTNGIHEPECCPFCGNAMQEEQEHDCLEALQNDLNELLPKIDDLEKEISDLNIEKTVLEQQYTDAKQQYDSLNDVLDSEYRPQIKSIKRQMREYGNLVRDAKAMEIIRNEYDKALDSQRSVNEELNNAITSFDPIPYLSNRLWGLSEDIANAALRCNFPNGDGARFDLDTFDIKVGDDTKADFGKGYIAFLNSICTSTLHMFVNDHGIYGGSPFIIDSPILSLREMNKLSADEREETIEMKEPLFEYFLRLSRSSQFIVIENELPQGFEASASNSNNRINVIEYGKPNGRKGFLLMGD